MKQFFSVAVFVFLILTGNLCSEETAGFIIPSGFYENYLCNIFNEKNRKDWILKSRKYFTESFIDNLTDIVLLTPEEMMPTYSLAMLLKDLVELKIADVKNKTYWAIARGIAYPLSAEGLDEEALNHIDSLGENALWIWADFLKTEILWRTGRLKEGKAILSQYFITLKKYKSMPGAPTLKILEQHLTELAGKVSLSEQDYKKARTVFSQLLNEIDEEQTYPKIGLLGNLAEAEIGLGNLDKATELCDEAEKLLMSIQIQDFAKGMRNFDTRLKKIKETTDDATSQRIWQDIMGDMIKSSEEEKKITYEELYLYALMAVLESKKGNFGKSYEYGVKFSLDIDNKILTQSGYIDVWKLFQWLEFYYPFISRLDIFDVYSSYAAKSIIRDPCLLALRNSEKKKQVDLIYGKPQEEDDEIEKLLKKTLNSLDAQIIKSLYKKTDESLNAVLKKKIIILDALRLTSGSFRQGILRTNIEDSSFMKINALLTKIDSLLKKNKAILDFTWCKRTVTGFILDDSQIVNSFKISMEPDKLKQLIDKYIDLLREPEIKGKWPKESEQVKKVAGELYDLLIRPVEEKLNSVKCLYVIPDENLFQIPFAALYDSIKNEYVLQKSYTISYNISLDDFISSASTSRKTAKKTKQSYPLVAFAPSYKEPSEEEKKLLNTVFLGKSTLRGGSGIGTPFRVKTEGVMDIEYPLFYSRNEVEMIAEILGGGLISSTSFNSTPEKIKTLAQKAKFLHIATHGIENPYDITGSAILVGSSSGERQWLFMRDIAKWDLSNIQLVFLSACETAGTQTTPGWGLAGVLRAFRNAGAKTACGTLWKVDSTATARIAEYFYLNVKKKKLFSLSLKDAQIALLSSDKYSHPFFWAPFVIYGD